MCAALDAVYIATCDDEIAQYAASVGAPVVMTDKGHERASDRTAEAMQIIEAETDRRIDIVVMIQGDEPMLVPEMIDAAVGPLLTDDSVVVSNLMAPLKDRSEHEDPNEVKVVVDGASFALYFSREAIPSWKKGARDLPMMKQVCIIPFRRDFLIRFNQLTPTPLEIAESVDMLRVLEHGFKVKMVPTTEETYSVDTPEDLKRVAALMVNDPLISLYGRG